MFLSEGLKLNDCGWSQLFKRHAFVLIWLVFVLWGRGVASSALEFDEAEQILHAQFLSMGYSTQPPAFEWLLQGWGLLWGGAGLGSLLSLKAVLLTMTYACVYRSSLLIFKRSDWAAAMALAVFLLPQMLWEIPRTLTHTLVATAFLAATLLLTIGLMQQEPRPKTPWLRYVLLGICTAGALLSKYNSVVVVGLALLSLLVFVPTRQRLSELYKRERAGIVAAVVVACLLVLPHVIWLLSNWQAATSPIVNRLGAAVPLGFWAEFSQGMSGLGVAILSFYATLLWVPLWGLKVGLRTRSAQVNHASFDATPHFRYALIYVVLFALFCFALIVGWGTHAFRDRWLTPFLFWTPALLVLWLAVRGVSLHGFVIAAKVLMGVIGLLFVFRAPILGWMGNPGWLNVPAATLAKQIDGDFPLQARVIASNIQLAGDLRLHSPSRKVIFPTYDFYSRQGEAQACELLLVMGEFVDEREANGFAQWPIDMLKVVEHHWGLESGQGQQWVDAAASSRRVYTNQALYSNRFFQAQVLRLKSPHPCH